MAARRSLAVGSRCLDPVRLEPVHVRRCGFCLLLLAGEGCLFPGRAVLIRESGVWGPTWSGRSPPELDQYVHTGSIVQAASAPHRGRHGHG